MEDAFDWGSHWVSDTHERAGLFQRRWEIATNDVGDANTREDVVSSDVLVAENSEDIILHLLVVNVVHHRALFWGPARYGPYFHGRLTLLKFTG